MTEMERGWLNDLIEKFEDDPDFIAEGIAISLMEEACELMEDQGISRSKLAERMGVDRARVTRMFNAAPNLTLRSIAQLAVALGTRPHASLLATCPTVAAGTFRVSDWFRTTAPSYPEGSIVSDARLGESDLAVIPVGATEIRFSGATAAATGSRGVEASRNSGVAA